MKTNFLNNFNLAPLTLTIGGSNITISVNGVPLNIGNVVVDPTLVVTGFNNRSVAFNYGQYLAYAFYIFKAARVADVL